MMESPCVSSPTLIRNNHIITVSEGKNLVVNFDESGRLLSVTRNGETFRRSLSGDFYRLGWSGDKRIVEKISGESSKEVMNSVKSLVSNAVSQCHDTDRPDLNLIERKTVEMETDRNSLLSVYRQMPLIPPGLSRPIYVELSYGCIWNRCTICSSHLERHYEERSLDDFMKHLDNVASYFGQGISSRTGVLLGDANAMNIEQKTLNLALSTIKKKFGLEIQSSFDIFTTPKKKNMIHFQDMKRNGLDRVNVYIQSGAYKVLRMLNEHTNATEILNLVNNMKDSGLGVSLILLAGTGGKLYREDHVEGTANLVSQMLLDAGDTVYISPIVEEEDPSYGDSAARIGTSPLSNDEKYLQMAEIEKRIKTAYRDINGTDFPARIVKYDLRECI